jgi:hypothetical protein
MLWVAATAGGGWFENVHDLDAIFASYADERERLWGAACLRDLGAWWLPQLTSHSLLVANESLAEFVRECRQVLSTAEQLATEVGCEVGAVTQALRNMLGAAETAQRLGGWIEFHSRFPPHPGVRQVRI